MKVGVSPKVSIRRKEMSEGLCIYVWPITTNSGFAQSPASLFSESCEGSPYPWWTMALAGLLTCLFLFPPSHPQLADSGIVEKE